MPGREVILPKIKQIAFALFSFFLLLASSGDAAREAGFLLSPGMTHTESGLRLEFDGFGLFPVKDVELQTPKTLYLMPGGHSIGVLLRSQGIMVVGFSPVILSQDQVSYPAKEAGMETGDLILSVNGLTADTDDHLRELIAEESSAGKDLEFAVEREGKDLKIKVTPEYCTETESYRIGLFVRDNAGGVGTLTFYDQNSGIYGALGHVVTNGKSSEPIHIAQGRLLLSDITEIHKGAVGDPGEKVGSFLKGSDFGSVEINGSCGIYGKLTDLPAQPLYSYPLPAAYSHQIAKGAAQILTVVEGQEIQAYDIEIQRLLPGRKDGKNMIIEITDPELLEKTGGIIQGMSGSPILQDGKIIGAVTHVFVNDPTRGYGVFIENMLKESGILPLAAETLGGFSQSFCFREKMDHNRINYKNSQIFLGGEEENSSFCRISICHKFEGRDKNGKRKEQGLNH